MTKIGLVNLEADIPQVNRAHLECIREISLIKVIDD